MNNNRLCPSCRNPLLTNTCKKCGYKHVVLQVVDVQQDFAKFSYLKKVRNVGSNIPKVRRLTKQEKINVYLREFQRMLKKASENLAEGKQLNITASLQFKEQVRIIWQAFLIKKKDIRSSISGMFRKYLAHDNIEKQELPKRSQEQEQSKQLHSERQKEKEDEEATSPRKRGRKGNSKGHKELSLLTQFRCYLNISVKPLIPQSIDQRKLSLNDLTAAQKSFLSYFLASKTPDTQLLQTASYKYIKLLHTVNNSKISKSYIKESLIVSELKIRGLNTMKTKEDSILLVLLFDLLHCWSSVDTNISRTSLREFISLYETTDDRFPVVEAILEQLEGQRKRVENPNIPQISYQLIYAVLHLATVMAGLTISLGEVITSAGRLSIPRIQIEDNLFLSGVPNEEVISCERIRKQSHLLANFLNLSFPCYISKWTLKWCKKLSLDSHTDIIELINRTIFDQAKLKFKKNNLQDLFGQTYTYHRLYELEQDIASLVGILVFIKLANGLNDYPYLVLTQPEDLNQKFNIESEEFQTLRKLLKDGQITVCQQDNPDSVITKIIPDPYRTPFKIESFCKRLSFLNRFDKHIGFQTSNTQMIRLRNLSNLNGVSSVQLLDYFKEQAEERRDDTRQPVKLRFEEIQQIQQIQKQKKQNRNTVIKNEKNIEKDHSDLHQHLKNQLGCIVNNHEKVIEGQSSKKIDCLIDQPCSNYELMYEYSSENLKMVGREEQLWVMEQLCMNNCTYNELSHWLCAYEAVLKLYQTE